MGSVPLRCKAAEAGWPGSQLQRRAAYPTLLSSTPAPSPRYRHWEVPGVEVPHDLALAPAPLELTGAGAAAAPLRHACLRRAVPCPAMSC
jgi:hypothetical protein